MQDFNDTLKDCIDKAVTERGQMNILIAGRTGSGKSTLINAFFQHNLAETGQGRPVTPNTREIRKDGVPISILDTRGLEIADFKSTFTDLEKAIQERYSDLDSNKHVHVAWLCIQEDGRRVENAEIDLHNMLSRHVPVITVITKARNDSGFSAEVLKLLPNSKSVVRVCAIPETLDEGHVLKPMGLENLVEITSEVIPEGKRMALSAAQKVSVQYKKMMSLKIVAEAASVAAVIGVTPIPFSDVAILAPIQVGMIAKITSTFGVELSTGILSTLLTSAIGVTGASLDGGVIMGSIIKMFPGAGTIVGGAICAATASTLTVALGETYIAVLGEIFTENPDAHPTSEEIAERFKEKIKLLK